MEDAEKIRPMATIQRIKELNPIPDADRIEVATVLGWKVVVKKNEFKVGDLAVFFEVGSILPRTEWSEFLFKPGIEDKTVRLKTVRLKKQLSQGLVVPVSSFSNIVCSESNSDLDGLDVTELLGVTKYEPPCTGGDLQAKSTRPHWVFKTDEPRVQGIPWIVDYMQGKQIYVTQKLDGSSMSIGKHCEYGQVICSRNMSLKLDADNRFTKAGRIILDNMPSDYLVQGELVGPGIQDNRLGLGAVEFYAFNVWNLKEGSTSSGKLLDYDSFVSFCDAWQIKKVPTLHIGEFKWKTIEELLAFANCRTYANGHPQEGVVIRPKVPEWHDEIGMLSFKVINNEFLLKIGE